MIDGDGVIDRKTEEILNAFYEQFFKLYDQKHDKEAFAFLLCSIESVLLDLPIDDRIWAMKAFRKIFRILGKEIYEDLDDYCSRVKEKHD